MRDLIGGSLRVVSHTCSNTEIVWALGCAAVLVGVDSDSDFPPSIVAPLPKLGRDLEFDIARTAALRPDLVLTSLTVPGHERIVNELQAAGLNTLVIDPIGLDGVYDSIRRIAEVLDVPARGEKLVDEMREQMPPVAVSGARPKILVEWWPKPVIGPAQESWVSDLIHLAGGENPWAARSGKSLEISDADAQAAAPEVIVMSWCGVKSERYRPAVVARRPGWSEIPAVKKQRIHPITEAFLGRPGPRLVEGYLELKRLAAIAR